MKNRIIVSAAAVSIILILGLASGCSQRESETQGASKLIVMTITGTNLQGSIGSSIIYSDVISSTGSISDDSLSVDLTAEPMYPYLQTIEYTWYQDIILDQVDIEFTRADGLSREGIDVPFSFSQQVYARVALGSLTTVSIVIVSHNAKSESPLIELVNHGQEHILKLEARITFHSKDLGGSRLEPVVAGVSVWCSNFADGG